MELVLLYLGIILVTGLLFGKLARLVKMPNVTGYLVGGVVLVLIFKLFNIYDSFKEYKDGLELIPTVALSFIAFSIGTDFHFSYFKIWGVKPVVIAIFEACGGTLIVLLALLTLHYINPSLISIPVALMLSAIAAATAPAATIMVIKQYKAKGEVTDNLLSVVAIDDAIAIILFGIMFAIANTISSTQEINIVWAIFKPFVEVIVSLGLGFIFGIIATWLLKWFNGRGNRLTVITALLLIICALDIIVNEVIGWNFSISTLLICMMMGATFTNTNEREKVHTVMELLDRFTPPLLIMFFVISGADLDLNSIVNIGIIGLIYIVTRVIGKVIGSYFGASITKSTPKVKKYLGWALLPQAGVAIGLSIVAMKALGDGDPHAATIRTVVLCATLIYELIGPFITKISLKKAGEIKDELKESRN